MVGLIVHRTRIERLFVGDVCLLRVGVRGGRPGLSVFALGWVGRREAESHDHAGSSTDATSADAAAKVPDVRPLLPADGAGDHPLQAVLHAQGCEEAMTMPKLPDALLDLIAKDNPDAVARYRQQHADRQAAQQTGPDRAGATTEEQAEAQRVTDSRVPEGRRTRRSAQPRQGGVAKC